MFPPTPRRKDIAFNIGYCIADNLAGRCCSFNIGKYANISTKTKVTCAGLLIACILKQKSAWLFMYPGMLLTKKYTLFAVNLACACSCLSLFSEREKAG
jgi:hypothetical protein